jgi:hypothetical protein
MSDTELHDLLLEVASQAVPTDLLPRVQGGIRARRRRRGTVAVAAAAVALAAIVLVATQIDSSSAPHPGSRAAGHAPRQAAGGPPSTRTVKPFKGPGVKLVAYSGKQPAGYTVDVIPQGWVLGGVNSFALTINSASDPNMDPSYFVGKLVVALEPPGSNLRTDGPKHGGLAVTVNGRAGLISGLGAKAGPTMAFYDAAGDVVDIEAPPALGWTTASPLVAFAEGIQVLGAAQPSYG